MNTIFINVNSIIDPKTHIVLLEKIGNNILKNSGLVLVIPTTILNKLKLKNKGKESIEYLNNPEFVNSIKAYCYLLESSKNVIISNMTTFESPKLYVVMMDYIVNIFTKTGRDSIILCIHIDIENKQLIQSVVEYGFHTPYIEGKNNLLCMLVENFPNSITGYKKDVIREVDYVVSQYNNKICKFRVKFDKDTISFLKNLCFTGYTTNKNGKTTQKEQAGFFNLRQVENNLFIIDIIKNSIKPGKEEGVDVSKSRYNFHTHPIEAYKSNKVKYGWPSSQDYIGFLDAKIQYNTSFHTVISIEGLYVISFTQEALEKYSSGDLDITKSKLKKYILDEYDHFKKKISIKKYINLVNNTKYKGIKLFVVEFITWDQTDKIFDIFYNKSGKNCIVKDDERMNAYYVMHNK